MRVSKGAVYMRRYVEFWPYTFKSILTELLETLRERGSLDAYDKGELQDIKVWLDETSRAIEAYLEDKRRQERLGAWMEK